MGSSNFHYIRWRLWHLAEKPNPCIDEFTRFKATLELGVSRHTFLPSPWGSPGRAGRSVKRGSIFDHTAVGPR